MHYHFCSDFSLYEIEVAAVQAAPKGGAYETENAVCSVVDRDDPDRWIFFGQSTARVIVPFDFSVGNATLPAGEYTVGRIFAEDTTALAIRSIDGQRQIIVLDSVAESEKTPSENKLVFRRYGDQYFLSQIGVGAARRNLRVNDHEREIARGAKVQEASIRGK
jgi:hypothetical protein